MSNEETESADSDSDADDYFHLFNERQKIQSRVQVTGKDAVKNQAITQGSCECKNNYLSYAGDTHKILIVLPLSLSFEVCISKKNKKRAFLKRWESIRKESIEIPQVPLNELNAPRECLKVSINFYQKVHFF